MMEQADKYFRDADLARIRELEAELAALRKQKGEPVAIIKRTSAGQIHIVGPDGDSFDMSKHVGMKLYREAAPRVPEGWKLVPVEPTEGMVEAIVKETGCSYGADYRSFKAYLAMLAAAPEPPEPK